MRNTTLLQQAIFSYPLKKFPALYDRFTYNLPKRHRGGVKAWFYSFFNFGARWGGWLRNGPAHLVWEAGLAGRASGTVGTRLELC